MNQTNNNSKRLPVKADAAIMTECWTYVKLAVIQSSSLGNAWLATHFDIFIDNEFKIHFGHIDKAYRMMDYNDLLDYSEINYLNVHPSRIVDLLISEIENNNYVSLFLSHFYLVHGFDNEKKVFNICCGVGGGFKENLYTYSEVEALYTQFYECYHNSPDAPDVLELSFFPITRISLRESYNMEAYFYEISKRFLDEIDGKKYSVCNYNGENTAEAKDYYTGLACLLIMEMRIYEYIRDQVHLIATGSAYERAEEMKVNFNKLYEHRKIILTVMKWLVSLYEEVDESIYSEISIYEECCNTMRIIANLAMKFAFTIDWDILPRMQKQLKGEYDKEKRALTLFHQKIYAMNLTKRSKLVKIENCY